MNTVFQDYALFPHMSILDNVAIRPDGQRHGEESAPCPRPGSAGKGGPTGFAHHRKPSQLSGGQRQRSLCRALVNQPRVLLLDEPLGALDLKLREQMQVELKKLQQSLGITFIFVTHDQRRSVVDVRPRGGV
ncbi:ATP-binding cassette domain-containing protein [Klebsiella variicola subsp. variicola]|nr:ATP-binding cassette domain-containing protein [Klebsiella variicola subsp. variicola]